MTTGTMRKENKILIISTKGIGNSVGLVKILNYLDMSNVHYDLVLRNNGSESVLQAFGIRNVDRVLLWDEKNGKLNALFSLIKQIRKQYYNLAVSTYPSGAKEVIMLRFARAKHKKILRNKGAFFKFAQFLFPTKPMADPKIHEFEHNASMLGVPIRFLRQKKVKLSGSLEKTIGFHVGSKGISKRWHPDKWRELARKIVSVHNAKFYIIAGPDEAEFAKQVEENFPAPYTPLIGLKFPELIEIMNTFSILIGNDSSVAHIAATLGIPTVVIWAYSDYYRISPYGKGVYVITRNYNCIPCYQVTKGYVENCKYNFKCIRNTTSSEVFAVVNQILKSDDLPDFSNTKSISNLCEVTTLDNGSQIIKFCDE